MTLNLSVRAPLVRILALIPVLALAFCGVLLGCAGEPTPVCGDDERHPLEECDDGNLIAGDGCARGCRVERGYVCDDDAGCEPVCGDEIAVDAEACDPSAEEWVGYCSADCTMITGSCGDTIVQTPREGCDDANRVASDGCDSCAAAFGFTCDPTTNVCDASTADPTSVLSDLTDAEVTAICDWMVGLLGDDESYDCGGAVFFSNSYATCRTMFRDMTRTCTVADLEAWVANAGSACGLFTTSRTICP